MTNLSYRHNDRSKGSQVLGVGQRRLGAAAPGDVDGVAEARPGAALAGRAGAGEEVAVVVPVDAHVQNVRVLVEDLLRSVAVMHVLRVIFVLIIILGIEVDT